MRPQLFTGARGQLKVNGNILAYITDVSISYNVSNRPVHTFGAINARSIEPLQAGPVQISIGRVIPVNKSNDSTAAVNTSTIATGIEPIITQMLVADDISLELSDKITGKTLANVKGCRFAGKSSTLPAAQLAQERIQLMGIYDAGPSGQNGGAENTGAKIGF